LKLKLKSESQVPYGGEYRINRPDIGLVGTGYTFKNLVPKIVAYRKANALPVGLGLADELEKCVCEQYPDACEECGDSFIRKRVLGLDDIVNGTRTMLSFWWQGRPLVDREESERRAEICLKCPYNTTFVKPCSGICQSLAELVNAIIQGQGTQHDRKLHSCQICGCFLQAAIWVPLKIQLDSVGDDVRQKFELVPNCWKKPSLL
jgi:hypothetical protein